MVSFSSKADKSCAPGSFPCSLLVFFISALIVFMSFFYLSHTDCLRGNNIQKLCYFSLALWTQLFQFLKETVCRFNKSNATFAKFFVWGKNISMHILVNEVQCLFGTRQNKKNRPFRNWFTIRTQNYKKSMTMKYSQKDDHIFM